MLSWCVWCLPPLVVRTEIFRRRVVWFVNMIRVGVIERSHPRGTEPVSKKDPNMHLQEFPLKHAKIENINSSHPVVQDSLLSSHKLLPL